MAEIFQKYCNARAGGVQLNLPPLQINDYCYALEILRAEMYVLYNTPIFLCTYLELASYSFVGYNIKTPNGVPYSLRIMGVVF